MSRLCAFAACSLLLPLAWGCGGSTPSGGEEAQSSVDGGANHAAHPGEFWDEPLPAASIPSAVRKGAIVQASAEVPAKGSPEWLIREIARLRIQSPPDTDDPERLRGHRRWKNERIIERAQEAIALTHTDPDRENLFNTAVGHLMEARLQLAIQAGPQQSESERLHVEELYSDAESLYRRDPKSQAAAEAAFVRARFANVSAERFAADDPRWLVEFSRQARLFADSFPHEQERSIGLLDAAGRSCELHFLQDEAVNCYALLAKHHPETPQGKQATAVLRRLHLRGERLSNFAGPTLEGGYAQIGDYRGRIVVVAFWASHSRRCVEQFPQLLSKAEKWGASRVAILGVSLDTDAKEAKQFFGTGKKHPATLFWPDAQRRSWNNPIVQYYGVRDIPTYWLIDAEGTVVSSLLNLESLEKEVGRLLSGK